MDKEKPSFGEELRRLREQKEFSVNQLALYSGVSAAHISRLERGLRPAPTPDVIRKLAKGLGVPYERLMEAAGYLPARDNGNGQLPPWWERDDPPPTLSLRSSSESEVTSGSWATPWTKKRRRISCFSSGKVDKFLVAFDAS